MKPLLAFGGIWHAREAPGLHAFAYRMAWLWCDIDALDRGEAARPWVGAGTRGVFRMRRRDHLQGTDGNWRQGIEGWLSKAGIGTAPRIHLLALPSFLGRTFNPVSFWIGRGSGGEVLWMVAEVNNTFGGRHLYPLDAKDCRDGRLVWKTAKSFPVSPFHGVEGEYEFRLGCTDAGIEIGIDLRGHGEGVFRTGMALEFREFGSGAVAGALGSLAASVVLTVPRILWQAARLHFAGKAVLQARKPEAGGWTIHHGTPVLLQRLVANPAMGRIWKRAGQIMTYRKHTQPGAVHGTGIRHPIESS